MRSRGCILGRDVEILREGGRFISRKRYDWGAYLERCHLNRSLRSLTSAAGGKKKITNGGTGLLEAMMVIIVMEAMELVMLIGAMSFIVTVMVVMVVMEVTVVMMGR